MIAIESENLIAFFADAQSERSLTDLSDPSFSRDIKGWFVAKVFMRWPPKKGSGLKIQVTSGKHRLDIEFRGTHIDMLEFEPHDLVKFSLRGASILPKKCSGTEYLPFRIAYEEAVTLQFVERLRKVGDSAHIVDTWQILQEDLQKLKNNDNDWFSTPLLEVQSYQEFPLADQIHQPVVDAEMACIGSCNQEMGNQEMGNQEMQLSESISLSESIPINHDSRQSSQSQDTSLSSTDAPLKLSDASDHILEMSTNQNLSKTFKYTKEVDTNINKTLEKGSLQLTANRETAKRTKNKRKRKRDIRHDNRATTQHMDNNPEKAKLSVVENGIVLRQQKSSKKDEAFQSRERKRRKSVENIHTVTRNPALDFSAGFISESGPYVALGLVRPNATVSVVGVVRDISTPNSTRRKEYSISILLTDPSNCSSLPGFRVNCFTKRYKEWLPSLKLGEILLLRCVKVTEYQDRIVGTVYSDKLHWAAFDPSQGKIHFSDLNGAPSSELLDDGYGAMFDPFYTPGQQELEYCFQLGEWWKVFEEQQAALGAVVQVSTSQRRQFRLIQDMEVNQFSDVAVYVDQVVSLAEDNLGLMLTDYTPHKLIRTDTPLGNCGLWCVSSRMDAETRSNLKDGTYWRINNIRLKVSGNGFLEGDLYDVKWTQLDVNTEGLVEPFKSLLQRQKDHVVVPKAISTRRQALISDVLDRNFCDLNVEVLHCQHDDKFTDLYVTDYTRNTEASTYLPDRLHKKANHLPVFKITCWGERSITRELEIGSFYALKNVRIANDQISGGLRGVMNDCNERIQKIRTKNSDNTEIVELLRRKNQYLGLSAQDFPQAGVSPATKSPAINEHNEVSHAKGSALVHNRHYDQKKSYIKDITANRKCPNKFRLTARIVDFYPMKLTDFTVRRCKSCKKFIPESRHACTMCEDMLGQYVQWVWLFYVRLEDEAGDQLDVSVANEGTVFLAGLEPVDLTVNEDCLKKLRSLLQPLIGNLIEVHEGIVDHKQIDPVYGPLLDLALMCWQLPSREGDIVLYGLTGCDIVEDIA